MNDLCASSLGRADKTAALESGETNTWEDAESQELHMQGSACGEIAGDAALLKPRGRDYARMIQMEHNQK